MEEALQRQKPRGKPCAFYFKSTSCVKPGSDSYVVRIPPPVNRDNEPMLMSSRLDVYRRIWTLHMTK